MSDFFARRHGDDIIGPAPSWRALIALMRNTYPSGGRVSVFVPQRRIRAEMPESMWSIVDACCAASGGVVLQNAEREEIRRQLDDVLRRLHDAISYRSLQPAVRREAYVSPSWVPERLRGSVEAAYRPGDPDLSALSVGGKLWVTNQYYALSTHVVADARADKWSMQFADQACGVTLGGVIRLGDGTIAREIGDEGYTIASRFVRLVAKAYGDVAWRRHVSQALCAMRGDECVAVVMPRLPEEVQP